LDFKAFLFCACYRLLRVVTRFWHKTGTFFLGQKIIATESERDSMWTDGREDVCRSEAMSLEVTASKNSVEEKRREASRSADSQPRKGGQEINKQSWR
jgi:hypothetical protein